MGISGHELGNGQSKRSSSSTPTENTRNVCLFTVPVAWLVWTKKLGISLTLVTFKVNRHMVSRICSGQCRAPSPPHLREWDEVTWDQFEVWTVMEQHSPALMLLNTPELSAHPRVPEIYETIEEKHRRKMRREDGKWTGGQTQSLVVPITCQAKTQGIFSKTDSVSSPKAGSLYSAHTDLQAL